MFQRRLVLLAILSTLAVLTLGPATAVAAGPVISDETEQDTFTIPTEESGCAFDIIESYSLTRRVFTWSDADGNPTLQKRVLHITGTLTNATSGTTVPIEFHNTRTFDFVEMINTLTGVRFLIRVPGQGVLSLDAGRVVDDFSTSPPERIFVAGRMTFSDRMCEILT
jgi:hypothetical protein